MKISILGCGWLGFPLGVHLQGKGHTVRGSTTTPEKLAGLEEEGIDPYLIRLDPDLECEKCSDFWDSDLLVLNIPPGRGKEDVVAFHTGQIRSIIEQLRSSPIRFVIFASSTSVYPKRGTTVTEGDVISGRASRNSGEALIKSERLLMEEDGFDTTVLRFGGLYGYDRHPVRYLAGRKNLNKGNAPINLIHRDDCIAIISEIIEQNVRNEIFNAVSDEHPTRKEFYTRAADHFGLEPPSFQNDANKDYKIVSNLKLKSRFNYTFIHPDPLNLDS